MMKALALSFCKNLLPDMCQMHFLMRLPILYRLMTGTMRNLLFLSSLFYSSTGGMQIWPQILLNQFIIAKVAKTMNMYYNLT